MKRINQRTLCSLIALAMLAAGAMAQDETPTESDTPEPAPKLNTLRIGYNTWKVLGNRNRALQHGTPAHGIALEELKLVMPGSDIAPYTQFALHDIPDRDFWVGGSYIAPGGATQLDYDTSHRRYRLGGISELDDSHDFGVHATVSQSFGDTGAFVSYQNLERRVRPESPKPNQTPRTQRFAGGVQGPLGPTNAALTISQTRFSERTGLQPDSVQQVFSGVLSADVTPAISLTGSASYTKIQQSGLQDSSIRNVGLAAAIDLGSASRLHLNIGRQDLSLPNIQSDYDRQRFTSGAKLISKVGGWSLQAGVTHHENERVRTDRSFVDVPKWNLYEMRLARKLNDTTRLTLRGTWDDLTASAVPGTQDTRQLLWDDKAMGQAKVEFATGTGAGYASYTYRFRQNKARGSEIDWQSIAVGYSAQVNEKLSGYGEISYDSFRAGERVQDPNERLIDYFPESANFGAGFTYAISPMSSFSAGVNAFSTNNLWGSQLSTSYRRQLAGDRSLEVSFAPWSTHDRLLGQTGYSYSIFSFKYSIQF